MERFYVRFRDGSVIINSGENRHDVYGDGFQNDYAFNNVDEAYRCCGFLTHFAPELGSLAIWVENASNSTFTLLK
jgi:hypothetical protein